MARQSHYGSYDPRIKALIAKTGRIDLFPGLRIPRTTALHWIAQGFETEDPLLDQLAEMLSEMASRMEGLEKQLLEARTTLSLLKEVYRIMGFRINHRHIGSRKLRDRILKAIQLAMKSASRSACLKTLGLSLSRYKRWERERRGCGLPELKICPKYSRNQLTFHEIQLMREFVTSTRFSHFPIRSLHFYVKRKGLLYCTYSTWRKYIDQYGWLRPRKKKYKKVEHEGIRAAAPNQIWHVDVSHFIFPNGTKAYIQAVIDNYSRYVLAWQVLSSYDGAKTATLIEHALVRASGKKLSLIVDGGSENKGEGMRELEAEGAFKKKVARFEIAYSNSIVEALFRQLKNNYLYHQTLKGIGALEKHAKFWFLEHNEVIPHASFNGETPCERFRQSWSESEEIRILLRHEEAIRLRIKHNQEIFCKRCDAA